MRIFVMFGTQDKRFDRLLNAILESKFVKENDVYVQLGYTKGTYQGINCQEYYSINFEGKVRVLPEFSHTLGVEKLLHN